MSERRNTGQNKQPLITMKSVLVAVAAFAATALGHGMVTNFTTDGKSNQGFLCASLRLTFLKKNDYKHRF